MNTRRSANLPAQLETECVRQGSDPRSFCKERPRRRRNTSNRKQKCSTAKAFGKCSLQPRDEPRAAPSACVWPNSVDYTPNPELVQCSGAEMGSLSFFWPRSMRDLRSPTPTTGTVVASSQGDARWFGGCVQLHPSPLYSFIEEWSTSVLTSNPSPGGSHASLVG